MSVNRPAIKSSTLCKALFFNKLIKISGCAATAFLVIKNEFMAYGDFPASSLRKFGT